MSLTEMTQRGEEFERMPPHDVAAEQCVLGGMLLSKDAISDVLEVIKGPFDIWGKNLADGLPAPFFHRQLCAACGFCCGKAAAKT